MVTLFEKHHHHFIKLTDRKSIYNQIKEMVETGKQISLKELTQRRMALQHMLEDEDRIYQDEFSKKVKTRIDEDVKKRKVVLLQIKEERKDQHKKFVEHKKVQRELENCYEVREALRQNERMQVKDTLLEQIVEKERVLRRKTELDDYWRRVHEVNAKNYDDSMAEEKRVKRNLQHSTMLCLEEQIEANKRRQEEENARKQQERAELEKLIHDIKLEEQAKLFNGVPIKAIAYRKELEDVIAERKRRREADTCKDIEEERATMAKLAKQDEEERAALEKRKRAVYNATLEYIDYARRMHKLEEEAQEKRDARVDDLRHVDYCTKTNLKAEMERRAELAKIYYAELRRQMCEQFERRLREEQEQREQKMLINVFAHAEKTPADLRQERRKMRDDLDKQLAENERLRKEEEIAYNLQLEKLSNDRVFCMNLTEEYIQERKDYLPLHPNWLIYACPKKEYVEKSAGAGGGVGVRDGNEEGVDTCRKPCGCDGRLRKTCAKHNYLTELKAAPDAAKKRMLRETC